MHGSELLTKIRENFISANDTTPEAQDALVRFCDYAAQWLVERGCLGLGHAASGLTLRFSDGTELALFSAAEPRPSPAVDIPISGTNTKTAVNAAPMAHNSVQITGR